MKIYVSHSRDFDFTNDLYNPLKESKLSVEFIFPHENSDKHFNSRELFENKKCDVVLAEVSRPATGQGIELGWANVYKIPIVCFYKNGAKPSNSLNEITDKIFRYDDSSDLVYKLAKELKLNYA